MSDKPKCYGLDDWEHLEGDVETVIDRVIYDACGVVDEPFAEIAARLIWPIRVRVYRYRPLPPVERLARWALDAVLERLDEEYSDPDATPGGATPDMRAAALALGEIISAQYVTWACEPTGEVIEVTPEEAEAMTS